MLPTKCRMMTFVVMILANFYPEAFPRFLKVGMSVCLFLGRNADSILPAGQTENYQWPNGHIPFGY